MSHVRRRLYRSIDGCCVCRVKSSKNKFVSSSRFEKYFVQCFKLDEIRSGELCLACQKAVRLWMKQPEKDRKDYSDLVDSHYSIPSRRRSSSTGMKSNTSSTSDDARSRSESDRAAAIKGSSIDIVDDDVLSEDDDEDLDSFGEPEVVFDTPTGSPSIEPDTNMTAVTDDVINVSTQTALSVAAATQKEASLSPFIDLSTWQQEEICCGTIFRGPDGEVLVDPKWLRPVCGFCNRSAQPPTPLPESASAPASASLFNDKMFEMC